MCAHSINGSSASAIGVMRTILGGKMAAVDQSEETETNIRIHSLDAYRGVLMLLGIVLHGAIITLV